MDFTIQSVYFNGFEGNRKNVQQLYLFMSKCKRKKEKYRKWVIQADLARKFHQYLGLKKVGAYEIMVGLSKGQA